MCPLNSGIRLQLRQISALAQFYDSGLARKGWSQRGCDFAPYILLKTKASDIVPYFRYSHICRYYLSKTIPILAPSSAFS